MNEIEDEIKVFARYLHSKQLSKITLFLLESHRPLFTLFSYVGVSFSPLLALFCSEGMRHSFSKVLSSRESMELCAQYLSNFISEGEGLHE